MSNTPKIARRSPSPSTTRQPFPSSSNDAQMPAKSSEYYLSIPSYIAPVNFDSNVPKITDGPLAPSPVSASSTPSPGVEPAKLDPWDPQLNQSIKVESPMPKSPRSRASKFAPAAPSSGAAGFQRHRSPQRPSQPLPSENQSPATPSSAATAVPAPQNSDQPKRSASSGSTLSKGLARLSKSISLKSRTKPSDEPTPPPVPAAPQLPSPSATPDSGSATPGRRFVIPQTLEEWEAFNRAVLSRPPPSPSVNHGLAPPRRPFAPGPGSSGRSRPNSIVGAGTPGSSNPASPNQSPRRRPLPELPPPPIVQADWERRRSWSQHSKVQQPLPPTSRPSSRPGSRPSSPTPSTTPARPSTLRKTSEPYSNNISTLSLPKPTTPGPLPLPTPPGPSAAQATLPAPAPLETPAPTEPAVTPKEEPSVISGAPMRLRTSSLPSNSQRPQLSPIDTSSPSPSLRWKRPMSWVGRAPSKSESKPSVAVAAPVPRPAPLVPTPRARRYSASEQAAASAMRRGSVEIQFDTMSNGARMRARRKSSQEYIGPNTLKKRRPSAASERPPSVVHAKAATYAASTTDLLNAVQVRPPLRHSSTDLPSPDRKSRRLSVMGMLGIGSRRNSEVNLAAVAPPPPGTSRQSSLEGPQASIPSALGVRPSQDSAQPPSNADTSSSPLVPKPDLPADVKPQPQLRKRRSSLSKIIDGGMRLLRRESSDSLAKNIKAPQPTRPAGLMLHVPTAGSMSDNMPPIEAHLVASPAAGDNMATPTESAKATPPESAKTERRRSRRMSWTQAAMGLFRKDSSNSGESAQTKPRPQTPLALPPGLAAPQIPGHTPVSPSAALSRNSSLGAEEMMRHAKAVSEGAETKSETKSFRMSWRKKPAVPPVEVDMDQVLQMSPAQKERIERMSTPTNLPSPTLEMGDKSLPVGVFKTGGNIERALSIDQYVLNRFEFTTGC